MANLKPHKSLADQVSLLQSRGLIISDPAAAEQFLFDTNYYRLSGYLHDFKVPGTDRYVQGLTFEFLKQIYDFDRRFARIIMYALEDVEETLKSRFSYTVTSHNPTDPLIYLRPTIYRDYQPYIKFLSLFYSEVDANSNLPFVKHHNQHYNGQLPMWVAVELFTMGNLYSLFQNLNSTYQKELARSYNTGPVQLENWIENMTYTRNHIAHYMRLYNFNFGRTPKKCHNHSKYSGSSNMIFDQIYVAAQMYSDPDDWNTYVLPELEALFASYSGIINLSSIGFPANWKTLLTI